MSRGNRREDIFLDDIDRHDFLKTLAEECHKTGWQMHAYCFGERLGWGEGELSVRPKNDPGKPAIGVRLRRETTLLIKSSPSAFT